MDGGFVVSMWIWQIMYFRSTAFAHTRKTLYPDVVGLANQNSNRSTVCRSIYQLQLALRHYTIRRNDFHVLGYGSLEFRIWRIFSVLDDSIHQRIIPLNPRAFNYYWIPEAMRKDLNTEFMNDSITPAEQFDTYYVTFYGKFLSRIGQTAKSHNHIHWSGKKTRISKKFTNYARGQMTSLEMVIFS